jgi:hypothetical protein
VVGAVGIISWILTHAPARTRNQNLDISQIAIAGTVGRKCTNVHYILPPRYTASQQVPYEAFVPEQLRGEALECVIRQGGLRIKYLVPYTRVTSGHFAGVSSRRASSACMR